MKLGINAFNIKSGGAINHLVEVLNAVEPQLYGFEEIIIWSSDVVLDKLHSKPWLSKVNYNPKNKGWLFKLFWLKIKFQKQSKNCDLLYVPGGSYLKSKIPAVVFFQNILPFEPMEKKRYLWREWVSYLKLSVLNYSQLSSLKRSSGAIFPSEYAKNLICSRVKAKNCTVIPHGINSVFSKIHRSPCQLKKSVSINVTYVSIIDVYKQHWDLIEAVGLLLEKKVNVTLTLVGKIANKKAQSMLNKALIKIEKYRGHVKCIGDIDSVRLADVYKRSDIFVFASSCESISCIVQEAMAAGLPILCANTSAMPEILQNAGLYYESGNVKDLADKLIYLIKNPSMQGLLSQNARKLSQVYTWRRCAAETFQYLKEVAVVERNI